MSMSSDWGSPLASHSFGYMLMSVNPGSVLASFTNTVSSLRKKSTRAIPSQHSVRNVLIASALMLGADGVLIGSRLVASSEAATPQGFQPAILAADGDSTTKTTVVDIVRNYDWPGDEFSARALKNRFINTWHGREKLLAETSTNAVENELYWKAFHAGDAENAGVLVGEGVGLIRDIRPAGVIVEEMIAQAHRLLAEGSQRITD